MGAVMFDGSRAPSPTWTAQYPWSLRVLLRSVWTLSNWRTVQGIRAPVRPMNAVMPFLIASTPARIGVDWALRFSAAAGPVVGAGRPAVTWLKRVGRKCLLWVDQPYFTE